MSIALISKIWSMCLAACHHIVFFSWIHCNPKLKNAVSIALRSKIWSMCLATCHEIMPLYWIHGNPKQETPCPSPLDPRSGPCAWPHAIKLCCSLGSIATLNQQCRVHRPQIQSAMHVLCHPVKMFPSLGSIAFLGAAPCPTTSDPRSSALAWAPPYC